MWGCFMSDEPDHEKSWIEAWNYAGPELERIRRQELQALDTESAIQQCGEESEQLAKTVSGEDTEKRHGLEIFQQWMMRWRVMQLEDELAGNRDG
jgi:hypothetical protein